MVDHSKVKLGKKAAKIDSRTLKLCKYLTSNLPPAPSSVDWTGGVTQFGMMLNGPSDSPLAPDGLGDCTIAAAGHAEQIWSIAADGASSEFTPPDALILEKYEQWCGYNPADPSTDQGGVEIDVLNDWRGRSFHSSHRHRHPLFGYADPNPRNLEEIKQAIYLFGCVYIGLQLPISVQGSGVWDVSRGPDAIPGSWGGHAVVVVKYRTGSNGKLIFTVISWGELYDVTEDFWCYEDGKNGPYVDEDHALVSPNFLNFKTGKTPDGLDLAGMEADIELVAS